MELANQKHEEIKRRLMVVEEELERAIDKSDDYERLDNRIHTVLFKPTIEILHVVYTVLINSLST